MNNLKCSCMSPLTQLLLRFPQNTIHGPVLVRLFGPDSTWSVNSVKLIEKVGIDLLIQTNDVKMMKYSVSMEQTLCLSSDPWQI